jgi:hypothetical protein
LALLFLFYPAIAHESELPPAWDAGYVKAPIILPETTVRYDTRGMVGNGSCVAFVKLTLGVHNSWYSPRYVWVNHEFLGLQKVELSPGAIIILDEGYAWHMAIVESITDTINIVEQNYIPNRIGKRQLPLTYTKIVGYLTI